MEEKQLIVVKIRPIVRSDFQQLVEWINAPHVARFWDGLVDINSVEEKYGSRLDDNATTRNLRSLVSLQRMRWYCIALD